MKKYRLPRPRRPRLPKVRLPKVEAEEEVLPTEIQGVTVASKEEGRVGVALWRLGFRYDYQVELFGGRNRSGGYVLDFLVHTVPMPTPLAIHGTYWHSREVADAIKLGRVRQQMGNWARPVEIWDYQVTSIPHAMSTLRGILGKA